MDFMEWRLKLTLPSSNCNNPWISGSRHRSEGNDVRVEAVHCQIVVGWVNCHQGGRRSVRKLHLNVKQTLLKRFVFLANCKSLFLSVCAS